MHTKFLYSLFLFTILLGSCKHSEQSVENNAAKELVYEPQVSTFFINRFSKAAQDTLMANIITYVYKAPKGVSQENRFKPEHRKHFINEVPNFVMLDYFIDDVGKHYFLLLRPVKSIKNEKRAVAGMFNADENLDISNFVELFNTPKLSAKEVAERGKKVFSHIIKHSGELGPYYLNKDFIEFPDERCTYDASKFEWVYPRELEMGADL
ncbi:MAG: hypothetical protein ACK4GL_02940 [Flavobacteriales bacterium]